MAPSTCLPSCAWVDGAGGGTPGFQPVMSPLSLAKMNSAAPEWPLPSSTTKPVVGLNTWPVGPGPGMDTVSGTFVIGPTTPSPV